MPSRINAPTLTGVYQQAAQRFADLPAFATRGRDGRYHTHTFAEVYEEGLALATALVDLGLRACENVAVVADNRYEWIVSDYGILLAGAADVPRGTDTTSQELAYILGHCDARFVFVENAKTLGKVAQLPGGVGRFAAVVVLEQDGELPRGVMSLADLVSRGRKLRGRGDRRAEERAQAVRSEDLFTIIYTSGTTGTPKGVQLTHGAMASQIRNLPFSLFPGERALSILPIWHSYERVFEMISIAMGVCTYYTSIRTFADDLRMVKPHVMASAPRLWENLYQKLMARVKEMPALRRGLFQAARSSSEAVRNAERFFAGHELDTTGRRLPELLARAFSHAAAWIACQIPHRLLEPVVLAKLRAAVGCDEFRGTISGGGALQPHVDEFFNSIGIPVLEGYGLTETCPVLAVRTWKKLVIGTVGPAYPETEVRIVDLTTGAVLYPGRKRGGGRGLRGEIHVRGPQVMVGYYKDPENTARVLHDGWLNTGDIGMVTFNNCLKILGRSKDTIVLLSGENVEPVPIEGRLTSSPLIDAVMVTGQDQKQLGALIVPSPEGLRAAGFHGNSLSAFAADPAVWDRIETEIKSLINADSGFRAFERITAFRLLEKPFEVGDELTQTLKLRRHVLQEKYRELIAAMHAG
jgi:long-chain acyl-CoA synthetase